ncbi:MAG: hypothetical protein AAF363_16585 [Bacteroidota bacterium]
MDKLKVPEARNFGWKLKPISSVHFKQIRNRANQICVVLNHSILRGVSSEMIYWWFKNFPNLKVRLVDVKGYEDKIVPAYLLWHPSDHINARLSGNLGPGDTSKRGAKIHIQEVMQYEKHGLKYPVNQALEIFYYERDGWCMGKRIPLIGKMMSLRISFKDVVEQGEIVGVHYHYEIVAGSHKQDIISQKITNKVIGGYDQSFWNAWLTHNTIEVGVFENFLPSLFEQRDDLSNLHYSKKMNQAQDLGTNQSGYRKELFQERISGYKNSKNGFDYQKGTEKCFL